MFHCRLTAVLVVVLVAHMVCAAHSAGAETLQQSAQMKAGGYFPATKSFDVGTGVDLVYALKPVSYAAVDAGIGYYRAENGTTGFISALPLTISVRALLPLHYINAYAGGGVGGYFKMAGGTTELPADHSEFSFGYHATAGIEFPTSNGLSLLLEGKYAFVDQGKFKSYGIKHDGAFLYGGFALSF